MLEIANKIALLTGAANGIGFAFAKELLRNGVGHVAILDLENSNGNVAADKLNGEFGKNRVIFIVCDVSKPHELEAGFARTVNEFGGIDIVINNAGIMDDSRWELMISINLNAVVHGMLLAQNYMRKEKGGKGGVIVNISSISGVMPTPGFSIYTATKHAIIGLSRSYAISCNYDKTGIRVLTLCPGSTETELVAKAPERMLPSMSIGKESLDQFLSMVPTQTVDNVAQAMMQIIRSAPSGSVWIAEGGEPAYEILIPHRHAMKISIPDEQ